MDKALVQILKSSIILMLGIGIGIINRMYLLPIALTAEEIGLFQVLLSIVSILALISSFGITVTISKYFEYFKKKKLINQFLGFIVSFVYLLFIITSLIYYAYGDYVIFHFFPKMSEISIYSFQILILVFFTFNYSILTTIASNYGKITVPFFLNKIVFKVLNSLILLLILYNCFNSSSYFMLYNFISFLMTISILYYVLDKFKIKLSLQFGKIQKKDYKKIYKYSSFIFLGSISTVLSIKIDSVMLANIEGFGAAGIYSIAFFMGSVIELPKMAISRLSFAIISKHWENNQIDKINIIYKKTAVNQSVVSILLLLLLYASIDEVFSLIPNSSIYLVGKNVALIIGFTKVFDLMFGLNTELLKSSSKYKWDLYFIIIFIFISISFNLYLIPKFSLNGAAIATFLSVAFYNLFRYFLLKKVFNLTPFNFNTIKIILMSIVFFGFIWAGNTFFFPQYYSTTFKLLLILFKSVLIIILFLSILFKTNISEDFNLNLISKFNQFKELLKR